MSDTAKEQEHVVCARGNIMDLQETNLNTIGGCKSNSERRRRSVGGAQQRCFALTKSFSSRRFLPLENDGEDSKEMKNSPPVEVALSLNIPMDESLNSSLTTTTAETVTTASLRSSSTHNQESLRSEIKADTIKPSRSTPPRQPPRRTKSNIVKSSSASKNETPLPITQNSRNTKNQRCTTNEAMESPLPRSPPRRRSRSTDSSENERSSDVEYLEYDENLLTSKLQKVEMKLSHLNRELTNVEVSQQHVDKQNIRVEKVQLHLQQELDSLQSDLKQKLTQIEYFEAENDHLEEECLHYETQVFAMTKSLEACLAERDIKKEEYELARLEWEKLRMRGSELLKALHDHQTASSSPEAVDFEIKYQSQKEALEEVQEEVRQLQDEVAAFHRKNDMSGPSVVIIADQPQLRPYATSPPYGTSPKRAKSLIPQSFSSPGSKSSGSTLSRENNKCGEKEKRVAAAKELRQDLKQRRHRRASNS